MSDDRISSLCLPGKYTFSIFCVRILFTYARSWSIFHWLRPSWPTAHLFSTYSRAASLPAPLPEAPMIYCLFSFGREDLKQTRCDSPDCMCFSWKLHSRIAVISCMRPLGSTWCKIRISRRSQLSVCCWMFPRPTPWSWDGRVLHPCCLYIPKHCKNRTMSWFR